MSVFTLAQLCTNLTGVRLPPGAGDQRIRHVRDDSRQVEPGDLFVAVRGMATDGAAYIHEAAARGAVAVVAETPVDSSVPLVLVPDARIARAELSAAFYGHPAAQVSMIGITGTVGKTTVLAMLSEILASARISAGTIGSLGIEYPGAAVMTRNTTPGPLAIHEALSSMAAAGVRVAAMEVTSHALVQERVYGLEYDLGVFTNLTMLEHLEYHRSFREYATAKLRFLEHLKPDAPLIYSAGDRVVGQAARRHSGPRVSCGGGRGWVGVRRDALSLRGARVTLTVRRPLPRLDGSCLEPCTVPLRLQTLGRPNIGNATLAAAAGLSTGASPEAVHEALARVRPPKRRLEVVRDHSPIIIDDTVGHPDSISGVFELVESIPHHGVRVVFCVRGRRGGEINARDAEALAIWARRVTLDALHVTSGRDSADERNEVSAEETRAFLDVLRKEGMPYSHHERLEDAIAAALNGAAGRDLVLLLGAQGMDAGAGIVRRLLHGTNR